MSVQCSLFCYMSVQTVYTIYLGQGVFHSVERKLALSNPVSDSAHDCSHVRVLTAGRGAGVARHVLIAQHHVHTANLHRADGGAPGDQGDLHTTVGQSEAGNLGYVDRWTLSQQAI